MNEIGHLCLSMRPVVTYINEPCHTWVCHVTYMNEVCHKCLSMQPAVTYMNAVCYRYEWGMSEMSRPHLEAQIKYVARESATSHIRGIYHESHSYMWRGILMCDMAHLNMWRRAAFRGIYAISYSYMWRNVFLRHTSFIYVMEGCI